MPKKGGVEPEPTYVTCPNCEEEVTLNHHSETSIKEEDGQFLDGQFYKGECIQCGNILGLTVIPRQ